MNPSELYHMIPKVDVLLARPALRVLGGQYGHACLMEAIRTETGRVRESIAAAASGEDAAKAEAAIHDLENRIIARVESLHRPKLRKVINGTGTILHTNLGRSPIGREQAAKLVDLVTGYSNLEYDLEEGKRGSRYAHFAPLICSLTGAEAAMVVNNNASAVLLILSTLAKGGEVIVSRGELVEIGGKFRVPDVMEQSGAHLVEVGTTNKTHLSDYEEHITPETKALLKVHTSNYRIVGFSESVTSSELKQLAAETERNEQREIPVIEDLGSGVLLDLEKFGLEHEPTVQEAIRAGVDVVCFSGDKLLGGPQAGIIVGKKKYIDRIAKNQLTRALRVDKFTVAALELVLMEYQSEETAVRNIPILRMISETKEACRTRAEKLRDMISGELGTEELKAAAEVIPCESKIGGGSLPMETIEGYAVAIRPAGMSVNEMETAMRKLETPVICRVAEDRILLDVRTLFDEDFENLAAMLGRLLNDSAARGS